jgi:hypothetical protein
MFTDVMKKSDLLFKEEVRLTEVKEYGYSWQKFAGGQESIPAEGLRFDIHFEGEVIGEDVNGRISGVDYLTVRADGRLFLDLYATIETRDGALISIKESGINANGDLRLDMDFHTSDERYRWINHKHVWGIGTVDFATGEVKINGYQN